MIKRMNTLKLISFMLISIMILSTGCGTNPTAPVAQEKKPFKIGMNLALNGPVAALDQYTNEGANVAVKEINAAGGINGRLLELIVEDNQTNPTTAVTAAKKLAENKDIIAIVGPSLGTYVLPTIPIYEDNQVLDIAMGSSLTIVEPIKKWIFKIPASDYQIAEKHLTYLGDEKKLKNIAILYSDDTSGNAALKEIQARAPKHGLQVVATEKFATSDTDMRAQLLRLNQSKAEAIIVWGSAQPGSIIAKNMLEIGMKQIILGSHGIAGTQFLQLAGKAAEGWRFYAVKAVAYKNLDASDPVKQRIDKLAPQLKAPFDAFHANGYDSIYLIAEALKKAGPEATRSTLRDQFEKIKDFPLLLSNYVFADHDAHQESTAIRFIVKNGEFWPDK